MDPRGRRGAGAFQWSRGGWFGGQVGATLWLVLLGGLLLAQSRPVGGVVLACGLVPNGVGSLLWWRRDVLAPYPALQALVAVCGLFALVAMLCLRPAGTVDPDLPLPSLWLLLVYPGLMLSFHLQERSARRTRA